MTVIRAHDATSAKRAAKARKFIDPPVRKLLRVANRIIGRRYTPSDRRSDEPLRRADGLKERMEKGRKTARLAAVKGLGCLNFADALPIGRRPRGGLPPAARCAVLLRQGTTLGVFHNALTRLIASDVAPQHLFDSYNEW